MKIAIFGCGKQAPKHINGFKYNGINDIVVFDVDRERAKSLAEQHGCKAVDTEADIFNDPAINAVDICTPVKFHKPLIEKAIAAGKHFFCEKPLSQSLEDDREIERLATENNVIGMVGYIYRFAPALSQSKTILNEDILGRVHTAFFRIGGRGNHMEWKHQRATDGGALNEMAVHMIDLVYWYFGDIEHIDLLEADVRLPERVIGGKQITCDAEDYVLAKLKSKSGVDITIMADFVTSAFSQYIEIQGENGSLNTSIQPQYNNHVFLINEKGSFHKGNNDLNFEDNNLFKFQMACFLEALENQKQPERCSLKDSVAVMEIHKTLKDQITSATVKGHSQNLTAVG